MAAVAVAAAGAQSFSQSLNGRGANPPRLASSLAGPSRRLRGCFSHCFCRGKATE